MFLRLNKTLKWHLRLAEWPPTLIVWGKIKALITKSHKKVDHLFSNTWSKYHLYAVVCGIFKDATRKTMLVKYSWHTRRVSLFNFFVNCTTWNESPDAPGDIEILSNPQQVISWQTLQKHKECNSSSVVSYLPVYFAVGEPFRLSITAEKERKWQVHVEFWCSFYIIFF